MNMSPNLIPVHRQLRNARSERLRAWGWACGVTMCIVTVWWLGCGTGSSRAAAPPPEAFTKTSAEISQANEESARLRRQLAELKEQVVERTSVMIFTRPPAQGGAAFIDGTGGDDGCAAAVGRDR